MDLSEAASMARWILHCPSCDKDFSHSEISDSSSFVRDPFTMSAPKPEFPDGGLKLVCPNCQSTSVYQRHQLIYQASRAHHA
jgi:endogenous inhibitor of DNA gyrase (YacG/DUF329 family)